MIDVVFLLLIFFIVTASFTKTERDLDAVTKVNQKSEQSTQTDLEPAIVVLVNTPEGYAYQVGTTNMSSYGELVELLAQFPNKADGAFVRAPDGAPYHMAASAIQACKDANFPGVSYVPMVDAP